MTKITEKLLLTIAMLSNTLWFNTANANDNWCDYNSDDSYSCDQLEYNSGYKMELKPEYNYQVQKLDNFSINATQNSFSSLPAYNNIGSALSIKVPAHTSIDLEALKDYNLYADALLNLQSYK